MQDLPTPILGQVTALTIATPDLNVSLAFYQKLGFTEVMRAEWPFPWVQVSDGVLLIMLRLAQEPYLALTYYVNDIDTVVADIESKGLEFVQKSRKNDSFKRYLLRSPDGLNVSLVNMMDGFKQPPGHGMLQMPPQDYFNPDKYVNKVIGLFGELAHTVADLDASLKFWELLGFRAVSKYTDPYPWAIISDGLSVVGLHQSTHFTHPTITFFAGDMQDKIARLKKAGITNFTEGPGNIALVTPEQQHIFLFPLGNGASKPQIDQPVIETERLLLRELNPDILHELFTTYADADIITFLGLQGEEELHAERNKWQLGYTTYRTTFKSFLLQEKESGKIIGKAGFHNWYPDHQRSEMGYGLTDESAKRKGYTTEAVKAIIDYGFTVLNLNRIEAFASPHNVASIKILEAAGLKKEGLLRDHFYKNGIMEDSACYALLKREYTANKS